ncbi:MAG: hypothetical protein AB2A00_42460 [Myxococcota bacterium]
MRARVGITTLALGVAGCATDANTERPPPSSGPAQHCFTGKMTSAAPVGGRAPEMQVTLLRSMTPTTIQDVLLSQADGEAPRVDQVDLRVDEDRIMVVGSPRGDGEAHGQAGRWAVVRFKYEEAGGNNVEVETLMGDDRLTITRKRSTTDGLPVEEAEGTLFRNPLPECVKRLRGSTAKK